MTDNGVPFFLGHATFQHALSRMTKGVPAEAPIADFWGPLADEHRAVR